MLLGNRPERQAILEPVFCEPPEFDGQILNRQPQVVG